jgi:thiol-disulfide isomerase/thioredoxin
MFASAAFSAFALLTANLTTPAPRNVPGEIGPGSVAPPLEIKAWLKGTPTKELDPSKTYVVEFWATWCGPCLESIPHLTELAKKNKDKVTFIGVSIWENKDTTQAQVQKFVDDMGAKMDYNVALGNGHEGMSITWMSAASQNGIPASFIIKGNKIQWIGHPMELEKPLGEVVAGTFDLAASKAEFDKRAAETRKQVALGGKIRDVTKMHDAGKIAEANTALDALEREHPEMSGRFTSIRLNWLAVDKPAEAEKMMEAMVKSGKPEQVEMVANFAVSQAGPKAKAPAVGAKAIKMALDNAKDSFVVYYYGVVYGQQSNDPKMTLKCVEDANRVLAKSPYKDNEGLKKFLGEAKAKAEASLKTKS